MCVPERSTHTIAVVLLCSGRDRLATRKSHKPIRIRKNAIDNDYKI
jgi:hypothetical protein